MLYSSGSMVKRLRHRPFTAVTRVRFPLESYVASWLSWLERRPVTAEVVGSSPIGVVNVEKFIMNTDRQI